MLQISCPSCGERGKIPANMIGARIKCKKCGNAFQVADPSKAPAAVAVPAGAPPQAQPSSFEGIAVEGLDQSAWSLAPESSHAMPHAGAAAAEPSPAATAESPPAAGPDGPTREYKLLTSRDKFFAGQFDLSRLEEAINHYARQGWVARSMCLPHIKNFQGAMQEEIVVLLER
jgi:hypothetical protein